MSYDPRRVWFRPNIFTETENIIILRIFKYVFPKSIQRQLYDRYFHLGFRITYENRIKQTFWCRK